MIFLSKITTLGEFESRLESSSKRCLNTRDKSPTMGQKWLFVVIRNLFKCSIALRKIPNKCFSNSKKATTRRILEKDRFVVLFDLKMRIISKKSVDVTFLGKSSLRLLSGTESCYRCQPSTVSVSELLHVSGL